MLNRLGKKRKLWEKARRELKVEFQRMGITRCEMCGADNFLGFAHAKKRRNLKPYELKIAALLCNPCHDGLEVLPENMMGSAIRLIIARRTA